MAPGVISQQGTDTFITTTIPPTMVTTANFFVGFLITANVGQFPAAFDETAPLPNRSWVAETSNINNLSGAAPIESFGLVGNWLIRAEGQTGGGGSPTPTATPSCTPGYTTATSTGTITAGGTDIGNHCDDCTTDITLPFPVSVYGKRRLQRWLSGRTATYIPPGPTTNCSAGQACVPVDPIGGQVRS